MLLPDELWEHISTYINGVTAAKAASAGLPVKLTSPCPTHNLTLVGTEGYVLKLVVLSWKKVLYRKWFRGDIEESLVIRAPINRTGGGTTALHKKLWSLFEPVRTQFFI